MYPFSYKSLTRRHRGGLVLPQPLSLNLAVPNTNSWDEAENCIPEEKPSKIITCVCEHILLSGEYTMSAEEIWVKPRPFDCLRVGRLLRGANLAGCVSSTIPKAAKGTAVPFLPQGSLTPSLHGETFGMGMGSVDSSTTFCSCVMSQPR